MRRIIIFSVLFYGCVVHSPGVATGSTSTFRDRLLTGLQHTDPFSDVQKGWIDWIRTYVPDAPPPTRELLPFLAYEAEVVMFSRATRSIEESGEPFLFEAIDKNRNLVAWAACGQASNFLIRLLDVFGIPARRVGYFNLAANGHSVVEVFSHLFGKYVLMDPLYATLLVNPSDNVPASATDLQQALSMGGWSVLRHRPYRYGVFTAFDGRAVSPAVQAYLDTPYESLLKHYLNYLTVSIEDYTAFHGFLPGMDGAVGRWIVYNNMRLEPEFSEDVKRKDWDKFYRMNSVEFDGGQYILTPLKLEAKPTSARDATGEAPPPHG